MAKSGRRSRKTKTSRSQVKENLNFLPFLPLDIIFNILILLPAGFLFNSVRYVCKAWASIIRDPAFIKEHLFKSNVRLLIQEYTIPSRGLYLDIQCGKFSVMNLRRCCPGKPIDSCMGLCLYFVSYKCHHMLGQKGKKLDES
ncbi:hypothetical protein ACH5RR_023812 [Cinchona calisaya]|uniref:F-box domain-containing protein n=1 Tax=Cinchona calisaya TaxID=153742 RepID=A0ABD2ZF25_9GENT